MGLSLQQGTDAPMQMPKWNLAKEYMIAFLAPLPKPIVKIPQPQQAPPNEG